MYFDLTLDQFISCSLNQIVAYEAQEHMGVPPIESQ